jgi:23S rRNA (uracil-5-)-methyltransferase RumA
MKRKQIAAGVIDHVDYPNKGRLTAEDGTHVTVKNTIPGQQVTYRVTRANADRAEGKLLSVDRRSPLETEPAACGIFPECGGCLLQEMPYEEQLKLKSDEVLRLLQPYFDEGTQFDGIKGSPDVFAYRNKMEFSFGNETLGGPLTLGLHRRGTTYDVLDAETCRIVHEDFRKILVCTMDYCRKKNFNPYNKRSHVGFLRYLLIRRARQTGEILVCIVTSSQDPCDFRDWAAEVQRLPLEGKPAGILHAVCDSPSDNVQADRIEKLYGRSWFSESLLGLDFRISLFSFFQTNSRGAEILYETVRDYVGSAAEGNVLYDLYCGTGTISQIMASCAKKVYGIELVEEAVEAARENAAMNGIGNCEFLCGDVLKKLDEIGEKPDYIILDPPREGIVPKTLMKLIEYHVPRMVYISCKASSLANDLHTLRQFGWRIERCALADLFPQTPHVETVVLMSRQNI